MHNSTGPCSLMLATPCTYDGQPVDYMPDVVVSAKAAQRSAVRAAAAAAQPATPAPHPRPALLCVGPP